jgi:hypothetical protein
MSSSDQKTKSSDQISTEISIIFFDHQVMKIARSCETTVQIKTIHLLIIKNNDLNL